MKNESSSTETTTTDEDNSLITHLLHHSTIELPNSNLNDSHIEYLTSQPLDSLSTLDFSNNNITTTGSILLSKYTTNHSTLLHINLFGNEIGEDGGISWAQCLVENGSLVYLNLGLNDLGVSTTLKTDSPGSSTTLKTENATTEPDTESSSTIFAHALRSNHTLKTLILYGNNYTPPQEEEMIEALNENNTLKEFQIRWDKNNLAQYYVNEILGKKGTKGTKSPSRKKKGMNTAEPLTSPLGKRGSRERKEYNQKVSPFVMRENHVKKIKIMAVHDLSEDEGSTESGEVYENPIKWTLDFNKDPS